MNSDFIKQKYNEGKNTDNTHLLILRVQNSSNLFALYLNKEYTTYKIITNFIVDNNYDFILLISLEHELEEQIVFETDEKDGKQTLKLKI